MPIPLVITGPGGTYTTSYVPRGQRLVVEPEAPEILARALRDAREADEAARRAQAAHRRLSAEFALEPWIDAHERLYRRLPPASSGLSLG